MKLEGIITPIVTPFHRDEEQSINYEATKQLIDHLIAKGVKGIFILGSNGEFHVIEEAEKIEFAEKVIGMVDHRVPVYVGTGACSTKETIRLSKKMEELGADALSVITPYFLTPTEEELVQHFTAVAESVSIPIILYNIPKATGCNLSAEVVGRLAEVENIRGIKDSSGKEENLKAYAELAKRDDFDLLIGSDSKISYGYALGASGAVAGTSNVITEVLVVFWRCSGCATAAVNGNEVRLCICDPFQICFDMPGCDFYTDRTSVTAFSERGDQLL